MRSQSADGHLSASAHKYAESIRMAPKMGDSPALPILISESSEQPFELLNFIDYQSELPRVQLSLEQAQLLKFVSGHHELPRVLTFDQPISNPPAYMRQADLTVDLFLCFCARTFLQARQEAVIQSWMAQARDALHRFVGTRMGDPLSPPLTKGAFWRLVLNYSLGLRACLHGLNGNHLSPTFKGSLKGNHLSPRGNPSIWWFIGWKDQDGGGIDLAFKRTPSHPNTLVIFISSNSLGTPIGITFNNERILPYYMRHGNCLHLSTGPVWDVMISKSRRIAQEAI